MARNTSVTLGDPFMSFISDQAEDRSLRLD